MAEKRKRGQNFSSEEKQKLLNLLRDPRETILNKKTDGTTNEAKALAWANLTLKFNSSNNCPRTKDSLMKVWEKMKTEAKLNKNENKNCNTGTGGGPNTSKYDPVLEQTCDLMGRGCTGILGVNDSDATTDQIQIEPIPEHIQPIIITLDKPFTEDSIEIRSDCEETAKKTKIGGEDDGNTNNITDPGTESSLLKTPLWARRRRPQLSSKNERSESCTGLLSSYKDVNVRKLDAEDLKLQLLQEEISFKQELQKRQLEEIGLKQDLLKIQMEAASYELEIKKEVLSQIKALQKTILEEELLNKRKQWAFEEEERVHKKLTWDLEKKYWLNKL